MRIFSSIYTKMLVWAEHRHANKYLAITSIAESSFFPIPVDIMLAPMVLARPNKWLYLAFLTTIMSVIGGVIGYFIGVYFMDWAEQILREYHQWQNFITIQSWFQEWGIWVVLVLGFSPLPYKVATIAAGSFGMSLIPFIITSFLGRSARFFLVAFVTKLTANKIKSLDLRWIERIGWITVMVLLLAIGVKWLS